MAHASAAVSPIFPTFTTPLPSRMPSAHANAQPIAPTTAGIAAWLATAVNHERDGTFHAIKLERIRSFLDLIPPPPAPCTVAGTKGKGSTLRLIECALNAGGIRTVAFTSPHVADVRERWRVDGVPAAAAVLARLCDQVAALEALHALPLTYFERTFAVACLLAAQLAAQRPGTVFLCEVGLGGRLDCANALDCSLAVITHLSHDHRDVLGPTLLHIAREKLAVTRPSAPVVIAPQSTVAALALWRTLPGFRAPNPSPARGNGPRINLLPRGATAWAQRTAIPWELALPGDHQQDNAATAAAALRFIAPDLDNATIRRGFANARLAARCQLITSGGRQVLIDGAHNGPSIAATLAVARARLAPGWRLLLGLATDKEIDEVLAVIPPGTPMIRVGYDSPRARGERDWPPAARNWPWAVCIGDALANSPTDADLCVTGSFYLAGEALNALGAGGDLPG